MKIMNKLAGKISALLLGSAMFATTLGLGIAALPEKGVKATAATTAETIGGVTVQNIEDVIADKSVGENGSVRFSTYVNGSITALAAWNSVYTYTTSTGVQTKYVAYNRLPEEGDLNNTNTYDGNISVGVTSQATTYTNTALGVKLMNTSTEDMVSFRWVYPGDSCSLTLGMRAAGPQLHWNPAGWSGGYAIILNRDSRGINICHFTASTLRDYTMHLYDESTQTVTAKTMSNKFDYTNVPAQGDNLVVTYGIYADTITVSGEEKSVNALYIRVINETQNNTAFEQTYYDLDPSTVWYASGKVGESNKQGTFYITAAVKAGVSKPTDGYSFSQTLGGIEEPIFLENTYTASENYELGTSLAEVATAEGWTGFNFAEGATVAVGTNTYEATKTVDYYGNSVTYNYDVTVTGTCDNVTTVSASYEYGKTLADLTLPEGYAFKAEDLTKELRVGTIELVGTYNGTSAAIITVEVTAPAVQKLETLIDSRDDIHGGPHYENGWISKTNWNQVTTKTFSSGYTHDAGFYDRLPADQETTNPNLVNGNFGVYTNRTDGNTGGIGFHIENSSRYGLISLRTVYLNGRYNFNMLHERAAYPAFRWDDRQKNGYSLILNNYNKQIGIQKYNTAGTSVQICSSQYVSLNGTVPEYGAEVILTYGVYPALTEDGVEALAFYVKLETAEGVLAHEATYYDTDYANTKLCSNEANMRFSVGMNGNMPAITFGGIDKPLFASAYADAATVTGTAKEGNALSTLTLPTGYAWKNSAAVLAEGENSCEATYTGTYYGKAFSFDVTVSVTAEGLPKSKVTFLDANGGVISSVSGKAGQQVTFADGSENTTKTFIGWKDESGKLYPAGYVLTAPEVAVDVTYTLVEIGFALEDGAAVRLIKANENGKEYGGLRFTVKLDDSTYVTALKAAIVPYDAGYYTDGAFTAAAISLAYALTDEHVYQTVDGTDYYGFTLTDIIYSNYNRAFAGMAFVTVTYQDGTTKDIFTAFNAEQNVRSVQQVATSLYAKHLAAIGSVENPYGLYGENALGILESYINGVVDLVYADGTFAVTTTEDGLADVAPTYALVENGTTVEGDTVTIQVQINVSQTLYEEGQTPKIPVTVRVKGSEGYTVVRIVKPTIVSYVDGVATISFKLSDLNV